MTRKTPPSAEWSAPNVRRRLQKSAKAGKDVSAQVFFGGTVAGEALADTATAAVAEAAARLGSAKNVQIGRVHKLAKSVSVRGDPAIIAELTRLDQVKTVLPSEVDDVYPKPVKRRDVSLNNRAD